MYVVVYKFADLQDDNHVYEVGDVFPHDGKKIAKKRIDELASTANKIGQVLIEEVAEEVTEPETEEA